LAGLIGEAFEALPAPDRWKLKDIEARLSRALTRKPQAIGVGLVASRCPHHG
jgi:hypothetical protein